MPVIIKAEQVEVRPGVKVDTMAAVREVLECRPLGGTVGDFHKTERILRALDDVASGTAVDLVVQDSDAPILAQLLAGQVWKYLTRSWIEGWVDKTIAALQDISKHP